MAHKLPPKKVIKRLVKQCLKEDIGKGDVTARLTPPQSIIDGKIITREHGIICGIAWVDEVFRQVGKRHKTNIDIKWLVNDGDQVEPNTIWNINNHARVCRCYRSHKNTTTRYSQNITHATRSAKIRCALWWRCKPPYGLI